MGEKKIRAAVIGCGGFGRNLYLPILKSLAAYETVAAADINLEAARKCAEEFKLRYATDDPERVFADPEVDAVFIATRHDSHVPLSIRAARAGKHILCEKPMGVNWEECLQLADEVRRSGVRYSIGYNRGLAPLVVKARELLADQAARRLIYHRIQAPFPERHWIHDPVAGGGRLVGEGCHIFDLLCELVPAPPVTVYACGGTFLDPKLVATPDSAIVTIGFADGSVGTTIVANAGCGRFPKEATEIYCAGRAIHINDFRELGYYGFLENGDGRIQLDAVDKGHRREVALFAAALLEGGPQPNGLEQALRAARISFLAGESIRTGQVLPVTGL